MSTLLAALEIVLSWDVIVAVLAASAFGLFVGAIPGLTATMAMAIMVPITFALDPVPAVGAMVACSAMAIFSGDIPALLLRMPGTPASAAYTEDGYLMTRGGQAPRALGACLVFSAMGGLFGTAILIIAAPLLAEAALKFSSFEYFWLAALGLTSAAFVASGDRIKSFVSLLIGLAVATVGIENPAGAARFTLGSIELLAGINFIAALIGLFALSEVLRTTMSVSATLPKARLPDVGNPVREGFKMMRPYWRQMMRGNVLGVLIGVMPGAGADIASWMAYAVSRRFSRQPEKYGTGHVEGIVESSSANNAAVGGAWVPALVFGVPGDSITAIVIGVLFMKGLNPGPTLLLENPQNIYAIFLIFILANLLMVPLGWGAISVARRILSVPHNVLMPLILIFCIVGSYASDNSFFAIGIMLVFGLLGYLMEENNIPIAPCILGLVLGEMVESNFITSMLKADGSLLAFFERPISGSLGAATLLIWVLPVVLALKRAARRKQTSRLAGGQG